MLSSPSEPFDYFLAYFLMIHFRDSLCLRHDLRNRVSGLFLDTWTYL